MYYPGKKSYQVKQLIICVTKLKNSNVKLLFAKYSKRAMYIPFKAAIDFKENIIDWNISLIYLDHNNEHVIIIKCNIYNPLFIYPYRIFS